jgi:hypothetical protein
MPFLNIAVLFLCDCVKLHFGPRNQIKLRALLPLSLRYFCQSIFSTLKPVRAQFLVTIPDPSVSGWLFFPRLFSHWRRIAAKTAKKIDSGLREQL